MIFWNTELETHFQRIKNQVAAVTVKSHYKKQLETRIKCDAPRAVSGAAFKQRSPKGCHTVELASRFLTNEERYSVYY